MKKTLSTMVAAVLLASTAMAPAFAQTQPAAPASPAPAAPMAPADPTAKPADSAAKPAESTGTDTAAASGSYLTEQGETQISANDYIGKGVYNADNKSIGDVNDLIFEEKGGIVAAVIGVGGFLGIGEKSVAVPMDKITVGRENNEVKLTTTETAEALQAAPEFKTLADKQAETDRTTTSSTSMPASGGATTPSTAPAPATPSK
jgi:sporulation protein YlmC with PRC-barrel domain